MKRDYDKYISIIDKSINVDWNFKDVYVKIVDEIIEEHKKELLHDETTLLRKPTIL